MRVSLPWYVAVQIRNPEFLRVFILEHNLARFGTNLYHHPEPFWYFIPVTLIGLIPWTVCVVASAVESVRVWWTERQQMLASEDALNVFLMIWLVVPVVFFSLSKSKLPGYIVPALPAGTLLLAEYLRRRVSASESPGILSNCFALDCCCDADCAGSDDSVHHSSASSSLGQSSRNLFCLCRNTGYRHCCHAIYEARLCRIAFYHLGAGRVVSSRGSASRSHRRLTARSRLGHWQMKSAILRLSRYRWQFRAFPDKLNMVWRSIETKSLNRYESGQIPATEHFVVAPEGSQTAIAKKGCGPARLLSGKFRAARFGLLLGFGRRDEYELGH